MLSKNQVVKRVNALTRMFDGVCNVSAMVETVKANGATTMTRETLHSGIPCRLSYQSSPVATSNAQNTAMSATQSIKLFLSADIYIPESSEIEITQYGTVSKYKCSGVPVNRAGIQVIELVKINGC